jgi:hypothetical protein
MENIKKEPKRFVLEVTDEDHFEIKVRAAKRRLTMRQYIIEAIAMRIAQERKYEKEKP